MTSLVACVDASPGQYPGFILLEPFPDWRGYDTLEIDIFLDDAAPRVFVLRVHDRQHNNQYADRYNSSVQLEPGFQTLQFDLMQVKEGPANRQLLLNEIDGVTLFMYQLERPLTFYLGEMRLAK